MIVFALKVSVTTKTNGWPVLSKKELGKTFPYFVGPLFHKSFEEYDYNLDFEAQSIILPRATSSTLIDLSTCDNKVTEKLGSVFLSRSLYSPIFFDLAFLL